MGLQLRLKQRILNINRCLKKQTYNQQYATVQKK